MLVQNFKVRGVKLTKMVKHGPGICHESESLGVYRNCVEDSWEANESVRMVRKVQV
jgi:hypothetical protein